MNVPTAAAETPTTSSSSGAAAAAACSSKGLEGERPLPRPCAEPPEPAPGRPKATIVIWSSPEGSGFGAEKTRTEAQTQGGLKRRRVRSQYDRARVFRDPRADPNLSGSQIRDCGGPNAIGVGHQQSDWNGRVDERAGRLCHRPIAAVDATPCERLPTIRRESLDERSGELTPSRGQRPWEEAAPPVRSPPFTWSRPSPSVALGATTAALPPVAMRCETGSCSFHR